MSNLYDKIVGFHFGIFLCNYFHFKVSECVVDI